ncbi:MAG: signal peptidase II [Coriobacteriia bacterium]|nr:signal peptidase II [Coriobacteriia bacterium]
MAAFKKHGTRARNLLFFAGCALAWLLIDAITKIYCEAQGLGSLLACIPDVLCIRVVHNYGAAWSMFEGNVIPLVVVALVICVVLLTYAVYEAPQATLPEMLALALVFAGGIGNMLDRIVRGYVVDMIAPLFIDFPTFNVADIGVTCGIALLLICLVVKARQLSHEEGVASGTATDLGCCVADAGAANNEVAAKSASNEAALGAQPLSSSAANACIADVPAQIKPSQKEDSRDA